MKTEVGTPLPRSPHVRGLIAVAPSGDAVVMPPVCGVGELEPNSRLADVYRLVPTTNGAGLNTTSPDPAASCRRPPAEAPGKGWGDPEIPIPGALVAQQVGSPSTPCSLRCVSWVSTVRAGSRWRRSTPPEAAATEQRRGPRRRGLRIGTARGNGPSAAAASGGAARRVVRGVPENYLIVISRNC